MGQKEKGEPDHGLLPQLGEVVDADQVSEAG